MNNFLKNERNQTIIISSIFIVLGLIFCIIPENSINTIEMIASIILIIFGSYCILKYCVAPVDFRNVIDFYEGLILVILGFLITFITSFFIFGAGLIFAILGTKDCIDNFKTKNYNKNWKIDFIFSIILAVLGLFICSVSFTALAKKIIITIFGCMLIYNGIKKIIYVLFIHKDVENFKKYKSGKYTEITDFEVK